MIDTLFVCGIIGLGLFTAVMTSLEAVGVPRTPFSFRETSLLMLLGFFVGVVVGVFVV